MIAKRVANRVLSSFSNLIVEAAFVIQVRLSNIFIENEHLKLSMLVFKANKHSNTMLIQENKTILNAGKHARRTTRTSSWDMSHEPY